MHFFSLNLIKSFKYHEILRTYIKTVTLNLVNLVNLSQVDIREYMIVIKEKREP